MSSQGEFAEQYTRKERVRFVLLAILCGGAVIISWHVWGLPQWQHFVSKSQCYEFARVNGMAWVFYITFVGLPLVSALVAGAVFSWRGFKILRDDQVPYNGEKVFRPTRIQSGRKARLIGRMYVVAPLLFVAIAVWGLPQARHLASNAQISDVDRSTCGIPIHNSNH